nr:Uncharacterised protein [Klebsiella pneumoniae]
MQRLLLNSLRITRSIGIWNQLRPRSQYVGERSHDLNLSARSSVNIHCSVRVALRSVVIGVIINGPTAVCVVCRAVSCVMF